ncbi:NUDIX domain-containing protein [Alkalibacillus haloalkaliphilus]|uniref:NUDIX domain-containing protein n=1 Tax=Alkalibacillus haloalkaliphilus TaxID=94136 RepID=UPI0002D7AB0F|nr:NUDIX domain-containing protein [Alkalibacillus haloalkaliphilus]
MIRKAVGAIVYKGNEFLLVHKVKVSALEKGSLMEGEWDLPKGGVEQNDLSLEHAILRELEQETGSTQYRVIKQFDDKICFSFEESFQEQTGWKKQETTMFLVEYFGYDSDLVLKDREIAEVTFLTYVQVCERLTHKDTKQYIKSFENGRIT